MTPFHLMLDILHHLDHTFGTYFYSIQNWILPPLPSLSLTLKKRSRYYIHTISDWIAIKKGTNNLKWELITTALKISYFQKHLWKDIRNYLIYIYMSKSELYVNEDFIQWLAIYTWGGGFSNSSLARCYYYHMLDTINWPLFGETSRHLLLLMFF